MKRIDRIRSGMAQVPRELLKNLILSGHRVCRQDKSNKRLRMQKSWQGDKLFRLNNTQIAAACCMPSIKLTIIERVPPLRQEKKVLQEYLRLLDDGRTGGIGCRNEASDPGNAKKAAPRLGRRVSRRRRRPRRATGGGRHRRAWPDWTASGESRARRAALPSSPACVA